jgi:hypothetical protein
MSRLHRSLPWFLTACVALLAAGCTPDNAPNPDAKKVISACLAVSADDASKILGATVTANRMTGDDTPISVCAYKDAGNVTVALVQIDKDGKYPDQAAALAAQQKKEQNLFSGNIKQPVFHPADGLMPGSYYGDVTPRFDALEVELGTFEANQKTTVVINNPKDFATGEKQAADIAHKAFESIQNGTALATLQ